MVFFGKPTHFLEALLERKKKIYIYIYIYIYGNKVYLQNILETQVIFENNVYFVKQLENLF